MGYINKYTNKEKTLGEVYDEYLAENKDNALNGYAYKTFTAWLDEHYGNEVTSKWQRNTNSTQCQSKEKNM